VGLGDRSAAGCPGRGRGHAGRGPMGCGRWPGKAGSSGSYGWRMPGVSGDEDQVRTADVVAALSLATDLGG